MSVTFWSSTENLLQNDKTDLIRLLIFYLAIIMFIKIDVGKSPILKNSSGVTLKVTSDVNLDCRWNFWCFKRSLVRYMMQGKNFISSVNFELKLKKDEQFSSYKQLVTFLLSVIGCRVIANA